MKRMLLSILLSWPVPLGAQDARLQRLDPALAALVQAQLDSARAADLPTEPLVQKALEGRGKGAAADRIVGAVRALRLGLESARWTLGSGATAPEIIAASNALRAGASRANITDIRRGREGPVQVPLDVLTDLIARGIPTAAAAAAVERLVRQGTEDREFLLLRQRVEQDIRAGAAPGLALERRLAGIPAAGPPRTP